MESRCRRHALALFALGGWVWLQLLATAYARGAGGDYPPPRYLDTLMFGVAVNVISMAWLWSQARHRANRTGSDAQDHMRNRPLGFGPTRLAGVLHRWWAVSLSAAWLTPVAMGVFRITRDNLDSALPYTHTYYVETAAHLRAYLATNDPSELIHPIPYLNPQGLIARLTPTPIRDLMPSSVRPPIPLRSPSTAPSADQGATENAMDGKRLPAASVAHPQAFVRNVATYGHWKSATHHGLSPGTPPLNAWPTWGSFVGEGKANIGSWRSAPVRPSRFGWLRIETAGDVGETGVELELRDAATNALLTRVRPSKVPHDTWRTVFVRSPRRPFVVVAKDDSKTRWLAFSAPVEMSSLSHCAWFLMKNGLLIAEVAAAVSIVLGIAQVVAQRRSS